MIHLCLIAAFLGLYACETVVEASHAKDELHPTAIRMHYLIDIFLEIPLMIGIFVFSFCVGYFLILKVPHLLHTPLMSMTNAVSGVTIIGALVLFVVKTSVVEKILGAVALVMAAFNVAGGFAITDRMLKMFKERGESP